MKSVAPCVLVALLIGVVARADEPTANAADNYVRPYPIVAIPTGASAAHKAAAKEIATTLGVRFMGEMKYNPVCCVWVEITKWIPNPGEPGYIIVNQNGGSIVSASDEQQLRAAVERLKKSIRTIDGVVEVPLGLLTSYPIVASAPSGK